MTSNLTRDISRPEFIALMAALMALNALAIDVILPALPYMGEALNVINENERQLVVSTYMLGFGAGQLFLGPISDRFGRRGPLNVGLVVIVVACIVAIFAPNYTTLLALRFVQGLGAAVTRVVAVSAVRDRFSGRAMGEVMSLVFMVFMVVPILAPSIGQVLLLTGPWESIFVFMAVVSLAIGVWAFLRLPETLTEENRRPLTLTVISEGFKLVFTNKVALSYAFAGTFLFGGLIGFIATAQQIYVGIYELGALFPIAFAGVAALMALTSYLNARMVARFGMRRLSHGAMLIYTGLSAVWFGLSLFGTIPFPVFFTIFSIIMCMFGLSASNMNSLSLEPLGKVAGTAASTFGFLQTVFGAIFGTIIGQFYNDTVTPVAFGFLLFGALSLVCILIAENGKLFGVGDEYK